MARRRIARRIGFVPLMICAWAIACAQVPAETVQWTVVAKARGGTNHRGEATVELSGQVEDGWHVYALTQPPGGPTPLRVTLDANAIAQEAGSPSATRPEKKYDPSFELETQYYAHSFTVYLPVRLSGEHSAGERRIPVSVRFQTCNGQVCEPPKTIHLSVPVDALSAG
jgi:hypothetical protein